MVFEGVVGWFSMLILVTIGAAIYPHAIQRIYAAGSELTFKRSLTWMTWAPFLTLRVVFLIGIIVIYAFSFLSEFPSEQLVVMVSYHMASQRGFFYLAMIIFFVGIIVATGSTAASVIVILLSVLSKDIYGR